MVFEGLDGLLCQVALMIVWGNKLERHLILIDSVLEVLRAFVVKDVEFGRMPAVLSWSIKVWYALIILPVVLFFIGSTRIT
jgi:hypothetical protein